MQVIRIRNGPTAEPAPTDDTGKLLVLEMTWCLCTDARSKRLSQLAEASALQFTRCGTSVAATSMCYMRVKGIAKA